MFRLFLELLRVMHRLYAMSKFPLSTGTHRRSRVDQGKDTDSLRRTRGDTELVRAPCSTCDSAKTKIEALEDALRDKEAELEEHKKREVDASKGAAALKLQAEQDHATMDKYKAAYVKLRKDAEDVQSRLSAAEERASRSESQAAELERALAVAQQERRSMGTMLETRTSELRDAQAYLTKVSDVTDRDVLGIVESINSRIYQTAASIADVFHSRCHSGQDAGLVEDAGKRLERAGLLSSGLVHALRNTDHREDDVLVQVAIQGVMVAYTRWLCGTWDFKVDSQGVLKEVHQQIRENEPQSVSGRWRALARTHVKRFAPAAQGLEAIARDGLAEHVVDVLLTCGVPMMRQHLLADVRRTFDDAFHEIAHLALDFQRATGEEIVSRDLFVVFGRSGKAFDPERMTDQWADPKKSHRRSRVEPLSVLCSTQLGLVREETTSHADAAKETRWEHSATVLLKPQVVLTTMLEELWNEQVHMDGIVRT